jgi:hypothetical protein
MINYGVFICNLIRALKATSSIREVLSAMIQWYLGKVEPVLDYPQAYFDSEYEPYWLESDFGRKAIREIDRSEVISGGKRNGGGVIDSPVYGSISPRQLSTGTRTLLLIANTDKYKDYWIPLERMGPNVLPYLVEVSRTLSYDIKLRVSYLPHEVPWDGDDKFLILPQGVTVTGFRELIAFLGSHADMFWKGDSRVRKD